MSYLGSDSVLRSPRFQRMRRFLDTHQPPDTLVIVISALIVGVGTALGAVVFIWLLRQIASLGLWVEGYLGNVLGLFAFMITAGLIVGYIVNRWAPEARGHGVPEVMEAIALRGGRIRARVAAIKVLASAITIGSGGSAGREGPIVQTGSALGSALGQWLHFSEERVQTLVACGAAAGIAATFNAPISGAIFALEVILGRFTTRYFGAVVISSVTAGIMARILLSEQPAFSVPAYPFRPAETPVYLVLAALAALVAVLFIRVLYFTEEKFDRWRLHPAFKAAVGMALTAAVALLMPERAVLGSGLHFIGEVIAEDVSVPLATLTLLLFGKLLATSFTLGSGNSGGVFAPSLFMGAVLGGLVGSVANMLWPEVAINPGAYAIVGMAGVFSGAARAPITAVLIVFEMSNDYKLILPLMLVTVIATLLAEFMFSDSIYTLKLRMKGITLQRGRDLDLMQGLIVSEAMTPNPRTIHLRASLDELGQAFQETHSHSFPVVDDNGRLFGMVSIRDYETALERPEAAALTVGQIATRDNLLVAYEDETLSNAIQRLSVRGINKMPVLSRAQPETVIGVIRRRDIIRAYNMALMRRAKSQFDMKSLQLRQVDDMQFVEVQIAESSGLGGRTLAEVARRLPQDCVVVAIRREGRLIVPHGNTQLATGDIIHSYVRLGDEPMLRTCLQGGWPTDGGPALTADE